MSKLKWVDPSQPQTLQGAVIFCYLNAALAVLFLIAFRALPSLLLILLAAAALGIANDKRVAYWAGVVLAGLYMLGQVVALVFAGGFYSLLTLAFAVLLFVLLVHPQSRAYQKVWFR